MFRYKIKKLERDISENLESLSKEIDTIEIFWSELQRIIYSDMNHSLMFQWWVNNEETINKINDILDKNS